jgi:hypothetical protein
VSEIHKIQNPIDQGQSHCKKGIDAASQNPIKDRLKKKRAHRVKIKGQAPMRREGLVLKVF